VNGLFDRGDLIQLVARFRDFTKQVLEVGSQTEQENMSMASRLRRSPFALDQASRDRQGERSS
jgi:hypothetical protein